MEKSNSLAKAAYVLSILAFVLSFFPLAMAGTILVHNADLMYGILTVGSCAFASTALLSLVCNVFAGDGAAQESVMLLPSWMLLGKLTASHGGPSPYNPTMKSPAAAWLARSGIVMLIELVLILIGLFVLVRPSPH